MSGTYDDKVIRVNAVSIENAIRALGVTPVIYEVPETACRQMGGFATEEMAAREAAYPYDAVWAAIEVPTEDVNTTFRALAQEAIDYARFGEFMRAVHACTIEETEPGRTAIVFAGFSWENAAEADGSEVEAEGGAHPNIGVRLLSEDE
jgi:hypothetical protein